MNGKSAPIPDLCVHFIKEIRKAQKESRPVDPRPWFKTLKRRGLKFDRILENQSVFGYDHLSDLFGRIKKEYEIHG
jgi:hypothetical protein